MNTYKEVKDYLGKKTDRPAGNNTRAVDNGDGSVGITLRGHQIVTFYQDDRVVARHCGWRTNTTKDRLNKFIPSRFTVYQEDFSWFLWDRQNDVTVPFLSSNELRS